MSLALLVWHQFSPSAEVWLATKLYFVTEVMHAQAYSLDDKHK